MKGITGILVLSAGVLLYGCSASPTPMSSVSTQPTTTSPTSVHPAAPTTGKVIGNWQFTATPSDVSSRSFSIAGGVDLSNPAASGELHIDNPDCFDPLISRSVTSTQSGGTTSLTAAGSDGQVVTLAGSFGNFVYNVMVNAVVATTFTGTYSVAGGCAAGEHGTVAGRYIYSIGPEYDPFPWSGTFTDSSTQQVFHGTGNIVESDNPDSSGSFAISGDATFDVACLSAGTMKAGSYPTASFILGTSVGIEFDTGSGIVTFVGALNPDSNVIGGTYTVSGSSCNGSGAAAIIIPTNCPGCWD